MSYDFNDADKQRDFDLIPNGSVLKVYAALRPGQVGDGGWLTASRNSDVEYLNFEFTVLGGPFSRRKFWENLTVKGGAANEKGESKGWNITKSTIRAMLNSARGITPDDDSERARQARVIQSWGDLDGLEFVCKVRVEPGRDGYPPRNRLAQVIEPGHKDYQAAMQEAGDAAPAPAGSSPPWSQPQPATTMQPQPQQPDQQAGAQSGQAASGLPAWAR